MVPKAGNPVSKSDTMNVAERLEARAVPINWHPGLSIYASESSLKTAGDEYGWLGGFDGAEKLRCVLPYTIIRRTVLRLVRFRAATIRIGEELSLEEEKSFLNSVVEHFRLHGASMIIPAPANVIFRVYPDGATAAPYGSYIVDLTQPEEALWNKIHSKHRNVIRNATKKGIEVQTGLEHLDDAYELIRDTLKRSRLGFMSRDEFRQMVAGFGENIQIIIARYEGCVQGCAVLPFSQYGAYYVYGGSVASPITGAMNLLHWEAIKLFKGLGAERYDFFGVRINPEKGSKQHGLMAFKERFGGGLLEGYMWKYPLKTLPCLAYSIGIRALRGGDIVDQEKHNLQKSGSSGGKVCLQSPSEAL